MLKYKNNNKYMKKYLQNLTIGAVIVFSLFVYNTASAQSTYVNDTTVILDSSVNPRGNPTTAWFEYSTDMNLYSPIKTPTIAIGSSNYEVPFSQKVTNLVPNTVYYYRVVANNKVATVQGNILSFITAPNNTIANTTNTFVNNTVFTNPNTNYVNTGYTNTNYVNTNTSGSATITNISATGAILNAVFTNPSRTNATGYFEWGPTQSFGYNTNTVALGTNYSSPFSGQLSNLAPNTTYYFRAIVHQGSQTYRGSIQSFQTYSSTVALNNQNLQSPTVTTYPTQTINTNPNINLSASTIFGSNSFLPNSLFGWILLLLLLIAITWAIKKILTPKAYR